MRKLATIESLRAWRVEAGNSRVGFVPTMGAMHAGHQALIEQSCRENEFTVVSIFVNPTQFNDPKDCLGYPSTLDQDIEMCREAGVDVVFLPQYGDLYPDGFAYRVDEVEVSGVLEGAMRPGHFQGVLTVVLKLLLLVCPGRAYFGEKDWQQLQLVRGMTKAFFIDTEIVGVPTVRDGDGLALSSRNGRLSARSRTLAPEFHRVLTSAVDCAMARAELESLGFIVEYVDQKDGRRLGAVQLEGVRLIDNVPMD